MSLASIFVIVVTIFFGLVFLISFFSFIRYKVKGGGPKDWEFDDESLPQKKPSGTVNIHQKKNLAVFTSGVLRHTSYTSWTLFQIGEGPFRAVNSTPHRERQKFTVINNFGSENRDANSSAKK